MDLRRNLEDGGLEGGTGTETHGKPGRAQYVDETVPRSTEGGQKIQGE